LGFVICNGPSLKMDDLEKLKNEITIASNKINKNVMVEIKNNNIINEDLLENKDKVLSETLDFLGIKKLRLPLLK
jgi:hypothetical protein